MGREPNTPHEFETAQIESSLAAVGFPDPKGLARGLQATAGHPEALAAVLSVEQLEALQIAVARRPRRWWRRRLEIGDHQRYECLERPKEWCSGIGEHSNRCDSCPTRNDDLHALSSLLGVAIMLRREWDHEMWKR